MATWDVHIFFVPAFTADSIIWFFLVEEAGEPTLLFNLMWHNDIKLNQDAYFICHFSAFEALKMQHFARRWLGYHNNQSKISDLEPIFPEYMLYNKLSSYDNSQHACDCYLNNTLCNLFASASEKNIIDPWLVIFLLSNAVIFKAL